MAQKSSILQVHLRIPVNEDAGAIGRLIADNEILDAVPGLEKVKTSEQIKRYVSEMISKTKQGDEIHFTVCLEDGEVIGMCALYEFVPSRKSAEIGFWIGKEFRQKGYGRAAIELLMETATHLGIEKLSAKTRSSNLPSMSLLHLLGFREQGPEPGDPKMLIFSTTLKSRA